MRSYTYKTVAWTWGNALADTLNMHGKDGWRFVHVEMSTSIPLRKVPGSHLEEIAPGTQMGWVLLEKVTTE